MKNKKLVELGILTDDENSGVSAISLVENPAIEVDFLYFKSEDFVENKNPKGVGTAKGKATNTRSAEVSKQAEETLQKKSDEFNEKNKDKLGYGTTVGMLKTVYQRGKGAYNTSHRANVSSSEQWAQARVNAFLYLVKNGRPENKNYKQDNDLLPAKHPKSDENNQMAFESYNDYPESAKANAQRALDYKEANPDNTCGTRVGWTRANQLANGENISEETIARMASFARHKQNSDTPYSEGCGGLMWDCWGGTSGIEWASNKLEEIRNEEKLSAYAVTNSCWKGYEPIGLKEKNGRMVPNCVKMEGYAFEELDIFGYKTRFFFICPGATATFTHLVSMAPDADTQGMIRSAAIIADRVFEIEKTVIEEDNATLEQLQEALLLVDDFYDLLYEIDEEVGMVHNVQYMDGHIEKIMMYLEEELSIDTGGLSPYVDEIGKKKDKYEMIPSPDYTEEELESIGVLAKALGIRDTFSLTERFAEDTDEKEIRYRYEGESPQRQFCRTFIGSLYTRDEINQLSFQGVNKSFGHNGQNYSLFKYKGGPYCKHSWQKYEVNLTSGSMRRLEPVNAIEETAATRPDSMTGNGRYPGTFSALRFADEEQRVVVGPAMIPEMQIPRKDADGDIYYVKFSAETIKEIMMKFMKEARTNATNQDHDEDALAGSYVYESWLVEDPENDKANQKYGFNVPAGTWMVSMKVDDSETWKRIKAGELKGFSVEGLFSDLEEIEGVKKYLKILNILKD